jgi:hypothetical protein
MSQVRSSGEERSENGKAPPDLPSLDILKRLSQANGVSGYESEAAQLTVQAITPFADEVHVDAMGNVVAAKQRPARWQDSACRSPGRDWPHGYRSDRRISPLHPGGRL